MSFLRRLSLRERAAVGVLAALGALLIALAPRRVELIVHNARSAPSAFTVGGEGVFLGPGASRRVRVAADVALSRSPVDGGETEQRAASFVAPVFGSRPVYLWRSGDAPTWIVRRGYGVKESERYPPQPLSGEPIVLLPGDLLPGIDPSFPAQVAVSRREAAAGVERRALFSDAAVRRFRASKALPAEDGPAVAPSGTGSLRVRQLIELLVAALLGAVAGLLGVALVRAKARLDAAGRAVPSVAVLAATSALVACVLLPFGRFASWVPASDAQGFSYSVLDMEPHDEGGHVAYLPSLLLDRDVDLYDADERVYYLRTQLTPTGRAVNYWTLGTPIVWFPFHAAAHLGVRAARLAGVEVAADGVSAPYLIALGIGSATCLLLGAWCCLGLGRRFGEDRAALVAAVLIGFSTPLIFYGFVRTRMDHAVEFGALAAAAWGWFALRERSRGWVADLGLGLLWGIAITTRQSNVVLLVGPALDAGRRAWQVRGEAEARGRFLRRALWVGLGLALPCLVHLVLLTTLWGVPYPSGPDHRGILAWPESVLGKLGAIWFGGWGLAILSPVWLAGLAGLGAMLARPRAEGERLLAGLCLIELAAALGIAVLLPEHRISAYGWRHLLAVQVFLVPGVVRVVTPLVRSRAALALVPACAALVLWQYLLLAQYPVTIENTARDFSAQAVAGMPKVLTSSQLFRSTALPRVLYRAATVEAPVPARDLAWVFGVLALFTLWPAFAVWRLEVWARRPARRDGIGRGVQLGVLGTAASLAALILVLLPGLGSLDVEARAARALASARRCVVDPLDALGTFARRSRVEAFVAEARALSPHHADLERTERVLAARYGEPQAAARRLRGSDDPELASARVIALRRTRASRRALRAPLEAAVRADPRNLRDRLDLLELLVAEGERARASEVLAEARRLAWRVPVARRLDALAVRIATLTESAPDPTDPRTTTPLRWVAGDVHLHSESVNANNPQSLDTADVQRELREQGLAVGVTLAWGLRPEATRRRVPRSSGPVVVGTEVSDFGNGYPDHVLMIGPDLHDFPRRLYALPIMRWARRRGALVGVAHANHWAGTPGTYPPRTTQSPFELPACVALGEELFLVTEAVESAGFRQLWYGLWNCGFRVPLAGGSDWPVAGSHAGDTRTYVPLSGPVTAQAWLEGVRRGRTVVAQGRGEFALLRIGSALPGAVIHRAEPGVIEVDVTTVLGAPGRVDLLLNGRIAERLRAPKGVSARRLRVELRDSGWLAVRTPGAHTGGITVEVGGRPVRASVRDAAYFVRYVDALLERLDQPDFVPKDFGRPELVARERAAAKADYAKARAVFAAILAEAEARTR